MTDMKCLGYTYWAGVSRLPAAKSSSKFCTSFFSSPRMKSLVSAKTVTLFLEASGMDWLLGKG